MYKIQYFELCFLLATSFQNVINVNNLLVWEFANNKLTITFTNVHYSTFY